MNHSHAPRAVPSRVSTPLCTNWKSCGSPPSEILERRSATLDCKIIAEPGLSNVDTHTQGSELGLTAFTNCGRGKSMGASIRSLPRGRLAL